MFSRSISETDSPEQVFTPKPTETVSSDAISKEHQDSLGPSAFEGTERPYIARLFDMGTQEILQLGLSEKLSTVDSYILKIVRERNWTDTKESYGKVLDELKMNLGIHPNLQPLIVLERLSKSVKLLRLQNMHKRRDKEIQKAILKINYDTI